MTKEKTNLDKAKKGNWIFLRAAQNNTIRTNYVKAKIDKTQQNSKFKLCGDIDETPDHIISEYSKLVHKEYRIRHDWVGKVIYWELCKKFNHTTKWYMNKPESVLKKETQNILWDFEIQINSLISARRSDLITVNKKKKQWISRFVDFVHPVDHRVKIKENEKRNDYLDLARELKKLWNMEVTVIPILIGALGMVGKDSVSRLEDLKIGEQAESIPITALLRSVRIPSKVLETLRCPRGVMVQAMDCRIVVREFVFQSPYYVQLSDKYPWERYEPPYPPSYGLNSTTTVLQWEWLWH